MGVFQPFTTNHESLVLRSSRYCLLWLSLRPNPRLTPIPKPGTDITTVVGQDITEDGEDTTDGADTTDTPTDTDTVTWENAPLMLNPKPKLPLKLMPLLMLTTDITDTHMLMDMAVTMVDTTDTPTVTSERDLLMLSPKLKPNPKLKPLPGTDIMVDTMVILMLDTDTDMLVPTDTMAVTGGKLSTMNSHFV